jgi:hypothetical protein
VIETESSRAWREADAPLAVRKNEWRAFLGRSIDVNGNFLTVPMQLFRCIRIVVFRPLPAFLL